MVDGCLRLLVGTQVGHREGLFDLEVYRVGQHTLRLHVPANAVDRARRRPRVPLTAHLIDPVNLSFGVAFHLKRL